MIFDARPCELGEGPLWHPVREQLFWFDILNRTSAFANRGQDRFRGPSPSMVSAAGWIDHDTLLIASETSLSTFDIETGRTQPASRGDNPETRSNDGRADRQGGFWIGTMGKAGRTRCGRDLPLVSGRTAAALSRHHHPELDLLHPRRARRPFLRHHRRAGDEGGAGCQGWPVGRAQVWLDLTADGLNPDGAVIDAEGRFWNAQWGAGRVAAYAPDGSFVTAVDPRCATYVLPGLRRARHENAFLHHSAGTSRRRRPRRPSGLGPDLRLPRHRARPSRTAGHPSMNTPKLKRTLASATTPNTGTKPNGPRMPPAWPPLA